MQICHVSHLIFSIGCWNVTCHLNILFILIAGHDRTFLTFFISLCQLFFMWFENDRFWNFKMGILLELWVWRVVSHDEKWEVYKHSKCTLVIRMSDGKCEVTNVHHLLIFFAIIVKITWKLQFFIWKITKLHFLSIKTLKI